MADVMTDVMAGRALQPQHDSAWAAFAQRLQTALHRPLPGEETQLRMAPWPRPAATAGPHNARRGGVLVLLYPHAGQLYVPLILRPVYDGVHSGQVGFPGGGYEETDDDLAATALREAYEEVGIEPCRVHVLGHLSRLHITASNYVVLPTVGWAPQRPAFRLNPYEVAQLVEAPLAELQDPGKRRVEEWRLRGRQVTVPFYAVRGQTIWGATAMMLSELLAVVERANAIEPAG